MFNIEHPDITHVNKTGYTRHQWKEIENTHDDYEHDRSEWDDDQEKG